MSIKIRGNRLSVYTIVQGVNCCSYFFFTVSFLFQIAEQFMVLGKPISVRVTVITGGLGNNLTLCLLGYANFFVLLDFHMEKFKANKQICIHFLNAIRFLGKGHFEERRIFFLKCILSGRRTLMFTYFFFF